MLDEKTNKIAVYPNPFQQTVTVKIENEEASSYEIYNCLGELIKTGLINKSELLLDLGSNAEGIYYLILRKEDKIVLNHKLIKLK